MDLSAIEQMLTMDDIPDDDFELDEVRFDWSSVVRLLAIYHVFSFFASPFSPPIHTLITQSALAELDDSHVPAPKVINFSTRHFSLFSPVEMDMNTIIMVLIIFHQF